MSRRRTKAEEIRNPEHYFNRYIACERKKEQEEDAEYYDLHESLDSMVERASAGYDRSAYRHFSVNLENEEIEDALAKRRMVSDCKTDSWSLKNMRLRSFGRSSICS